MDDKEFVTTTDNDFEKLEVPQKNNESESSAASKEEKSADKTNYLCCGPKLLSSLDPKVLDLVYWKCPKKSGIVLTVLLSVLLALSCCSILSVTAYLSLAALSVTFTYRTYRSIMAAVQKTNESHPFQTYLEADLSLPPERIHALADSIMSHAVCSLNSLRRLFLIENVVDSVKFGLCLWVLTYVGAWFNAMTLLLIGVICLFSFPKVYELNKEQIDKNLDVVRSKINDVIKMIQEKVPIPGLKKKEE